MLEKKKKSPRRLFKRGGGPKERRNKRWMGAVEIKKVQESIRPEVVGTSLSFGGYTVNGVRKD